MFDDDFIEGLVFLYIAAKINPAPPTTLKGIAIKPGIGRRDTAANENNNNIISIITATIPIVMQPTRRSTQQQHLLV